MTHEASRTDSAAIEDVGPDHKDDERLGCLLMQGTHTSGDRVGSFEGAHEALDEEHVRISWHIERSAVGEEVERDSIFSKDASVHGSEPLRGWQANRPRSASCILRPHESSPWHMMGGDLAPQPAED
eukprot:CAMPEP_0174734084 /NCGR_PEP_ID=MMETSP1094-20130205/62582_1 /TAXON_ID=156173 /ORGANISM="Chrysochromulina brevifilum, Strain UTEX LB 985" /LENGTH=126 /DNA_ID=CAMNT_0015936839 /DNA_START=971 /DNA_END=1349 /DNA_ORIENTATION=+